MEVARLARLDDSRNMLLFVQRNNKKVTPPIKLGWAVQWAIIG